ncbi:hypothetical protein DSOUD_1031 [Desulfuromonas soudanensis]|uniref:Uncharacterized protein n=1 Tax=Desulfuromonas soudanensis TaxID=1603606 RepID=A0A0M4D863_9BACT|nr:hypothetical protein [Desulfuromonas soudanensis]ALC15817.1 hypothetical protein DSOUD_1031 [Desulfuromonas soudanensis]
MDNTPKSKAEVAIERIMQELDPASDRYRILATAKVFKSSWVELGEELLKVSTKNLFRQWGYNSFDDYCTQEVRIKKPTAQKLTMAYRFMEKEEPELLARERELKPLPDYRSVDLLRKAREEKDFTQEEYADLRKAVIEEDRSHPAVLKRFKEVAAAKSDEEPPPEIHIKASLSAARRLDTALRTVAGTPEEFSSTVAELVGWLEEQLKTIGSSSIPTSGNSEGGDAGTPPWEDDGEI